MARLEFAFGGLPLSIAVSVLLAATTVSMLWHAAPSGTMAMWFVALATVNAARLLHYRHYRLQGVRGEADLQTFDRTLLIGCLAGGTMWGSAALLLLPHAPELQFFLAFVIAGVSSGAVTSLSVAPSAAYAFVVPCVMPLALRFLCAGDALHTVMGVMTCFYMCVVMLVARRGHIQLTRMVASQLDAQHSRIALDVSEAQRRSSDERLRIAADAGQIGVWEWDLRTGDLMWDERMRRIYCATPAANSDYLDVWRSRVHPADLDRVDDDLAKAVAASGHFVSEFRILWPTREERYIKAAADVLRAPDGTALRMVGINLDITELKRLERIKSEFVSTVSHELRTPLTSIRGALGLAVRDGSGDIPQRVRELLSVADRNAGRLSALIEDLLDAERLESGKFHCELHEQPLQSLLRQAVDTNTPYALQHQVTLELSHTLLESNVLVDGQRMLQVMTNLLSNAVKFSPRGGHVRVTLTQAAHARLRVSISDEGPGVLPEFQSRIFGLFSQGDASDTRAKGGAGLGLAISKALIEHMGGVIGFLPNEDAGTTFFFELPASSATSTASRQIADSAQQHATAREPSAL